MKIEYDNTYWQFLCFNSIHQFFSVKAQLFFLAPSAFFANVSYTTKTGFLAAVAVGVIVYVGGWIAQMVFNAVYLFSRNNQSLLTRHVIEIQDTALFEETKFNKSLFYWNGIQKVVRRPGFIAIYVSPYAAHIIPLSAFASKAEGKAFYAAVEQRMRG